MAPETVNLNMLYEKVGEVGAIAREAKHAANNASAKIDALAVVVATQGETRAHVERIEKVIQHQAEEIEDLKADQLRRQGAVSFGTWLLRYGPTLIGVLIVVLVVLKANGKI